MGLNFDQYHVTSNEETGSLHSEKALLFPGLLYLEEATHWATPIYYPTGKSAKMAFSIFTSTEPQFPGVVVRVNKEGPRSTVSKNWSGFQDCMYQTEPYLTIQRHAPRVYFLGISGDMFSSKFLQQVHHGCVLLQEAEGGPPEQFPHLGLLMGFPSLVIIFFLNSAFYILYFSLVQQVFSFTWEVHSLYPSPIKKEGMTGT